MSHQNNLTSEIFKAPNILWFFGKNTLPTFLVIFRPNREKCLVKYEDMEMYKEKGWSLKTFHIVWQLNMQGANYVNLGHANETFSHWPRMNYYKSLDIRQF